MNGNISIEECKNIQLNILKELDGLCKNNGLQYSLGYGTLIGSIRHKGFIPWDDDIDIFLLRSDYEQLIELLKRDHAVKWLGLVDSDTDGYYYPFVKAVDNRTIAKMEDNLTPHGIWVDIFPIDNVPEDEKECRKFLGRCEFLRAMIISMTTDFSAKAHGKKLLIKRVLYCCAKVMGFQRVYKRYESLIRKYDSQETGYAGCLSTPYIKKERFPKEMYDKHTIVEFEGDYFSAIEEYDFQLKQLYGDYMKLPPIEKRTEHHITAKRVIR